MKMHAQVFSFALGAVAASAAAADEPISYAAGDQLTAKYNCQSCHMLDKTTAAGPSLRDIAKRYASDPHAVIELEAKVRNGSFGAWGPIPMAPINVPDTDLHMLIKWILSLR
jgi:cytochrome c